LLCFSVAGCCAATPIYLCSPPVPLFTYGSLCVPVCLCVSLCVSVCPCVSLCVPVCLSVSFFVVRMPVSAGEEPATRCPRISQGPPSSVIRFMCIGARGPRASCLLISDNSCWRIAASLDGSVASCVFSRYAWMRSLTSACSHCVCSHCMCCFVCGWLPRGPRLCRAL
jgi:hypothetical protein